MMLVDLAIVNSIWYILSIDSTENISVTYYLI